MDEPIISECDNCGEELVEGVTHDCPVIGAPVTIEAVQEG